MSEKPQHNSGATVEASEHSLPRRVSRETSVTPEEAMLNDILDRAMNHTQSAPKEDEREEPAEEKAPAPEEKEALASPPKKNNPSSAFVYMAVLFGAAFLMLLLAYFVQQRNNAAVQDELRSTTASREELLEEIETLEQEKEALLATVQAASDRADQMKQENEKLQKASVQRWEELIQMTTWYDNYHILDCLEQFNRSEDYLMSGIVVGSVDGMFNRNNPSYIANGGGKYLIPAIEQRYMELREELFSKSSIMKLSDGEYAPGMPYISADDFEPGVLETAQALWAIIRNYAIAPGFAALQFVQLGDSLDQVNSRVFKQSTIDLLEEIKADLIAQGFLLETDGGLAVVSYPELVTLD